MDPSSTNAITEFAIVVAGFAGLVLALGARDGTPSPLVRYRTVVMLLCSFAAAFGSLLPILAASLEMTDIWAFSSYLLVVLLIGTMIGTIVGSRFLLNIVERNQLKTWMWTMILAGNSVFAIFLLATLAGAVMLPISGVFFGALIWQLVLSAVLFTRLILQA
jgi:hypothetical protein